MSYQYQIPFLDDDRPAFPLDRKIVNIILIVALIYFGFYFFIFRDIIRFLPELMSGEMVINGDELVPFFNPHSQFIDQAAGEFNDLTHGYEFRVRYSILTTWMRYYKILPFALLLVVPSVAFSVYLAISYFLQRVMPDVEKTAVFRAPIAPTLFIFMILSYTKITHFYTLIIGFGVCLIAILFFSYGFIFSKRHPFRYMAIGHLFTVFNPAIHYIVIYCMFVILLIIGIMFIELWQYFSGGELRRKLRFSNFQESIKACYQKKTLIKKSPIARAIGAFILLCLITLLPYAIFVNSFVLSGMGDISESIPVDYYFIKDASVPFLHLISFDLAGIMDQFLEGDYLTAHPRVTNIFYTIMMLMPLFVKGVRKIAFANQPLRIFFKIWYFILGFSFWASLGYTGPDYLPTFHRTIALISNVANRSRTVIGDLISQLMGTILQILRFPHRFQLILFLMACIILPISMLWIERKYKEWINRSGVQKRTNRYSLLIVLFFIPLLLNWQYRETFLSGNFMGFLSPYPVTPLKEVKEYILTLPEGKTIFLPPTETGKRIISIDGVEHKFIDKFHIYYLDLPSYYYGLSGDPNNKHEFFLLLRAMYYEQDWWVNIARDNHIKYIIVNKELVSNSVGGAEYLRDIEKTIRAQMEDLDEYFRKIFENESYILFEFLDLPNTERTPLFIDTEWNTFIRLQTKYPQLSKYYDLRYGMKSTDLEEYENLLVVADDRRKAQLDVYALAKQDVFFRPNNIMFPFDQNVIPSSYYIAPMFRLFQFFSDSKWNRLEMITPGMFGTISGTFIGLPRATTFRIDVQIPEDGKYHLLLRLTSTANSLNIDAPSLGISDDWVLMPEDTKAKFYEQENVFTPDRVPYEVNSYSIEDFEALIPQRIVVINNQFQYLDLGVVDALVGKHKIFFTKQDDNPMIVEGLMVIPDKEFDELPLTGNVVFVNPDEDLCCGDFPIQSSAQE